METGTLIDHGSLLTRIAKRLKRNETVSKQGAHFEFNFTPIKLPFLKFSPGFESNPAYSLEYFLKFHDREFVQAAYLGLLRREPDPAGFQNFLFRLRQGKLNKIEILLRIRYSPEGRRAKVKVSGLLLRGIVSMLGRIPIIGYLFNLVWWLMRLPRAIKNLEQFESYNMSLFQETWGQVNTGNNIVEHVINHTGINLLRLTDELNALKQTQQAQVESIQSQSEQLSLLNNLQQQLNTMDQRMQAMQQDGTRLEQTVKQIPVMSNELNALKNTQLPSMLNELNAIKNTQTPSLSNELNAIKNTQLPSLSNELNAIKNIQLEHAKSIQSQSEHLSLLNNLQQRLNRMDQRMQEMKQHGTHLEHALQQIPLMTDELIDLKNTQQEQAESIQSQSEHLALLHDLQQQMITIDQRMLEMQQHGTTLEYSLQQIPLMTDELNDLKNTQHDQAESIQSQSEHLARLHDLQQQVNTMDQRMLELQQLGTNLEQSIQQIPLMTDELNDLKNTQHDQAESIQSQSEQSVLLHNMQQQLNRMDQRMQEMQPFGTQLEQTIHKFNMIDQNQAKLTNQTDQCLCDTQRLDTEITQLRKNMSQLLFHETQDLQMLMKEIYGLLSKINPNETKANSSQTTLNGIMMPLYFNLLSKVGANNTIAPSSQSSINEAMMPLYYNFETKFRGSEEIVKQRLSTYVPLVAEAVKGHEVLDLGCGRGEWLDLMREVKVSAHGVDQNALMLQRCLDKGLRVVKANALQYLKHVQDKSLGCITGFHIAEHLPFEDLLDLIRTAFKKLIPGGLLILETPNPENLVVGACGFYSDPTHISPIYPPTLEFLFQECGFSNTNILRLFDDRGVHLPLSQLEGDSPIIIQTNTLTNIINHHLLQALDFAVIGRKS